jgi:hypothetical protein
MPHLPQHACGGKQHSPAAQQSADFALTLMAAQHAWGGKQHSAPAAQQLDAFALTLTEAQHSCGGKQQSSPAAQQVVFAVVAVALVRLKQHACGGLQQSAFVPQQLTLAGDDTPLQAVPTPITPSIRARGTNSFRFIKDLLHVQWSGRND